MKKTGTGAIVSGFRAVQAALYAATILLRNPESIVEINGHLVLRDGIVFMSSKLDPETLIVFRTLIRIRQPPIRLRSFFLVIGNLLFFAAL